MLEKLMSKNPTSKTLFILGNGFDLSCGLKSSYKDFFEYILLKYAKKSNLDYSKFEDIVEYIENEIFNYKDSNVYRVSNLQDQFISKLNPWYLIFINQRIKNDSEWSSIEGKIEELLTDEISIITLFGVRLLEVYDREITVPGLTADLETWYFTRPYYKWDIFSCISYIILNREERKFRFESTSNKYKELLALNREIKNKYKQLNSNSAYSSSQEENLNSIKQDIDKMVFSKVADVLLAELKEMEADFIDYLNHNIEIKKNDYLNKSYVLMRLLCDECIKKEDIDSISVNNVLTFNYTKPWDIENQLYEWNVFDSKNIHGELEKRKIIFGINNDNIDYNNHAFIFTKVSRTMELYNIKYKYKKIEELLLEDLNQVIIYGHSLSLADYAYFRIIFDKYVNKSEVDFYFVYNVYDGTTSDNEYNKMIKNISKLFARYSNDIMINNDLFVKLVQNNRIKIHEIDF